MATAASRAEDDTWRFKHMAEKLHHAICRVNLHDVTKGKQQEYRLMVKEIAEVADALYVPSTKGKFGE